MDKKKMYREKMSWERLHLMYDISSPSVATKGLFAKMIWLRPEHPFNLSSSSTRRNCSHTTRRERTIERQRMKRQTRDKQERSKSNEGSDEHETRKKIRKVTNEAIPKEMDLFFDMNTTNIIFTVTAV